MSVLTAEGPHVWRWPGASHAQMDVPKIIADLHEIGAVGVIAQAGLGAADWCVKHTSEFESAGIQMTVGLGMDGNHSIADYVHAIVDGIERVGRVGLDWEAVAKWECWEGRVLAKCIVDGVLNKLATAPNHVTDFGWWAPVSMPNGGGSHAGAPNGIFGQLCGHERYPQCYGAARSSVGETDISQQGRSRRYLAWARDPSQYASLGTWEIRPAYQAYHRTRQDHVESLLHDRTQCLWDLDEIDETCRAAMTDVRRLRSLGHDGPVAVVEFQASAALKADGVLGPVTSAALASAVP